MDLYQILKVLQDSGQFDKFRCEIFSRASIKSQFEIIQQRLINELSSSPLLTDVPLKMRQVRLPQIFNSFRLAVRKTSVANDLHSLLWNVINEMAPEIYSAIEQVISQPEPTAPVDLCPMNPDHNRDTAPLNSGNDHLQLQVAVSEPSATQHLNSEVPSAQVPPFPADNKPEPAQNSTDLVTKNDEAPESKKPLKASKNKKRGRLVRLDSKVQDRNRSCSTSDDDYVPIKRSSVATFTSPQEPISKRVEIWWPLDKTWYPGTVTAYRARDKKHHILYDDNEIEWLNLLKERWRYES